jgi:thymidylate synthase
MKQYLDLLQNIIDNGVEKESGRENMPNTIGISKADISMNLKDGFPLLTTKKMYWKGIVHELLWFLRGETNIKYLVDNNVNIWNGDAYRWYLKFVGTMVEPDYDYLQDDVVENKIRPFTMEEFIHNIKLGHLGTDPTYKLGDLGKVYGYQWRNQNGVDQVKDVFDGLNTNPYSRYHIIDGWNKADFPEMALPPCHLLYQFIVRPLGIGERVSLYYNNGDDIHRCMGQPIFPEDYVSSDNFLEDVPDPIGIKFTDEDSKFLDDHNIPKYYLDLNMYQRSCDSFLGVPFNIASMSLFLMLFAKSHNMIAGVANWIGGDTHLYVSHVETAKEQIAREPYALPTMKINKDLKTLDDILNLTINDFELVDYESHPTLKAELFTGLKK